ncbi:MAG: DUF1848 domain-containing protein [Alphaproteobacteria bacterium]
MIVSASYRTDIPAFFADWFRARLADGYCEVKNPYGGKPYRVALRGSGVDGFVFWTRNAAPFAAALDDVAALGLPFVVQFTVTGYPRALDAHTVRPDEAVGQIENLARTYGPRAAVWRYDPVVFTSRTPPRWHLENFARLARALSGSVDECVVSFAHIYKKARKRLDNVANAQDFTWRDPDWAEKQGLLARLRDISSENGTRLTVCSQKDALVQGVEAARCIDAERLSDVAGYDIFARIKGNRDGCLCAESRDIGAYDTCAHGCVYCYAVSDHNGAEANLRRLRQG